MLAKQLPSLHSTLRNSHTILSGGVAAAILIVVIGALVVLSHLRSEAELRTVVATQNLASSTELTIEGLVDTVDVALLASADEINRQMSAGTIDPRLVSRYLARQTQNLPHISAIRGTNELGENIYGPWPPQSPPINISDRDYFVRQRDALQDSLFISKPVLGRNNHHWVWVLSRRISKPDGSFGGVILAGIRIDEIERMLAQINMKPGSVISLRDSDLGLIARSTFGSEDLVPTGDKQMSPQFDEAQKLNPQEGTYISDKTTADNISRAYSYRRSAKYGFTIHVGIPVEAALAEWHEQTWYVAGLVAVFFLTTLTFSGLISRAWQHQEQALAALMANRESLHEAQQIAKLGQLSYDLHADHWTSSDVLDEIIGIGKDFPRDAQHFLELVDAEYRTTLQANLNDLISGQSPMDMEYRIFRHSDGQERWVYSRGRLHRDAASNALILHGTLQDITERKQQEQLHIEKERTHRITLVREVHHRIKNNLQGVAGLLHRELGKFLELDPHLETAISQVNAIAIAHGLQGASIEEEVLLYDSVQHICKTISDMTLRPVLFHTEREEAQIRQVKIEKEEAVSMALILNELILNAVKHSPDGSPDPAVSLSTNDSGAQMVIRNALAGTFGFDIATGMGTGTGLSLVRSLLPEQGAQLTYELGTEGCLVTRLILTSPVVATT